LGNAKKINRVIKSIIVASEPGHFTSLRIAVAIANTLAYSLQIPVVGVENRQHLTDNEKLAKLALSKLNPAKINKYINPFYSQKLNITIAKQIKKKGGRKMAEAVILWEGKEFPCEEALEAIKRSLEYELNLSQGKQITREVAITFSKSTGFYVIYYTEVTCADGEALNNGFVAKQGFYHP